MPLDGNHLFYASECAMKNADGHILVTGGAGYIGIHTTLALHDAQRRIGDAGQLLASDGPYPSGAGLVPAF